MASLVIEQSIEDAVNVVFHCIISLGFYCWGIGSWGNVTDQGAKLWQWSDGLKKIHAVRVYAPQPVVEQTNKPPLSRSSQKNSLHSYRTVIHVSFILPLPQQIRKTNQTRWLVILVIGILTAVTACLIDMCIETICDYKFDLLQHCILFFMTEWRMSPNAAAINAQVSMSRGVYKYAKRPLSYLQGGGSERPG